MQDTKVVISGGHLTPALALIDFILKNYPQVKIFVVGRLHSQSGKAQRSREQTEVKSRGIPFYYLSAPKFAGSSPLQILINLPSLFISIIRAWIIINKINPSVLVSFGGYLAVPLAVAAKLKKIPIITHEQTATLGLANRFISKIANRVAVANPQTLKLIKDSQKTVVTGNPIRSEIIAKQNKPVWLNDFKLPLIYITGGRLGSEVINNCVGQSLAKLLKKYVIIHQTGPRTTKRNYTLELKGIVKKLPNNLQNRYYQKEWITAKELGWILQNADLVISRAGANTTHEIEALGTPAILIPLPFAFADEQQKNAERLAEKKLCHILNQKDLNATKLISEIEKALASLSKQTVHAHQQRNLAAKKLWEETLKLTNQS